MTPQEYAGPIWVTFAYCLLYYAFVGNAARVKKALAREYAARGEPFDRYFTTDRRMLAADRLQLNTLEQMGPFLVLLWVYAIFVSPLSATVGGAVYVLARAVYPYFLSGRIGRDIPGRLLLTTLPGYAVIAWFAVSSVWATL